MSTHDISMLSSSSTAILAQANSFVRLGEYDKALALYEGVKDLTPTLRSTVEFNIALIKRRKLHARAIPPLDTLSTGSSFPDNSLPKTPALRPGWRDVSQELLLGPWREEFGPGSSQWHGTTSFALHSRAERYCLATELVLSRDTRYLIELRLANINGHLGEVVCVLIPEQRITLASATARSCGPDGILKLSFKVSQDCRARLRVGIGTTAAASRDASVLVQSISIQSRKAPSHDVSHLSSVTREYIDPELKLPELRGLGNDYSEIERRTLHLSETSNSPTLRLSVIIPGFERAHLLRNTLACLTRQSYPKELTEVIVVDDGSQADDYERVFFEFADKLNLYLCRQEKDEYGLSRARNLGARLARGDVLLFLDSDILLPREFISKLMAYHHASDNVSVLGIRHFVDAGALEHQSLLNGTVVPEDLIKCRSQNPHHRTFDETGSFSIDWRLTDFAATDGLKTSTTPFRYYGGGHSSVSRRRFMAVEGYDEHFRAWGNEDQDFAYRLWSIGQYFIPLLDCFDYHQEEPARAEDQTYKLVENQRTHEMLRDRCPHPSVRGFFCGSDNLSRPQFSIYIPAYNTAKYIEECISSALAQTYRDLEVVVVDDGSTDNTPEILRKFADDSRVRVIQQVNGGIGAASNTALRHCRGEFIVQLDSDDLLRPYAIERVAHYLQAHPNVECLYTRYTVIDKAGTVIGPGWSPATFDRYQLLVGMTIPHMRVFRRALYFRTTGFDETIANAVDYDFYLKMSEVAAISFLDEDLYLYRIHSTQTSSARSDEQVKNHEIVVARHLARLGFAQARITHPNPYAPRKNYISLPGSDFDEQLENLRFPQPKLERPLSMPSPRAPGNDYEVMQTFVKDRYPLGHTHVYTEKISIVVPVYNRAERLSRCLAGLFHQTYPRQLIEIIVVDDGSSDHVLQIIKKYSALLNLKYLKQADLGYRLSAARNAGVRAASHRNISIIDCDLIPLPNFIEAFMQYLHHFGDVVLLGHQRFVDPTGLSDDDILADVSSLNTLTDIRSENSTMTAGEEGYTVDWRYSLYKQTNYLRNDQAPYRAFSSGHVAYRKALIERAGMYDEDFTVWGCEDNEAGYRLYQCGAYFIPVLEAIDLHQEPPSGKNETNREAHRVISRRLLQEKVPATRGWFGPGFTVSRGMAPLVTVGIPMRNTGAYAVEAIRSALAQTMTDLEVLVYDDASDDGSLDLVRTTFAGDARVRIIAADQHRNVTYARQRLIEECRGEFLGFLDSDDLLEPDCVRECVSAFRRHPNVGIVCTGYTRISEAGEILAPGWVPEQFDREALMFGNIFTHFRMFRIRDLSRRRGWGAGDLETLSFGEDWDLCLQVAEVSDFMRISKPLYRYRVRSSGITSSSSHAFKAMQTRRVASRWISILGRRDLKVISCSTSSPSAIGFVPA